MKLASAEIMKRLDERTIREVGIPGAVLMENAGRGAAQAIETRYGGRCGRLIVLAGKGNNGGDGFVIARHLMARGWGTRVYLFGEKRRSKGDAAVNLRAYEAAGGEIREVSASGDLAPLRLEGEGAVYLDALLGTGLAAEVTGLTREAIEWMRRAPGPVVAVDIPSGLDATTGRVLGACARADLTVTFGLAKIGQITLPGAREVGELQIVDIGIPPSLVAGEAISYTYLLGEDVQALLSCRVPDAHKGSFGHVLVVAGSTGKTGAASMVALSALRAGAGLVTVAAPASLNHIFEASLLEVMTAPISDGGAGWHRAESLYEILTVAEGKDALAIGPGFGTSPTSQHLVRELVRSSFLPMVIDADGLNALAGDLDVLKEARAPFVLTPHPGEMSRLTGKPTAEIQQDRVGTAVALATEVHGVVVLKGARTVVASPENAVSINSTGNPGMASGGMGDVLTGLIGALLGSGYAPLEAAELGVYLHGLAGDLAACEIGDVGIIASDLISRIPAALRATAQGKPPPRSPWRL